MKPVGKPDAGNPHVRFDERGTETGHYATAPVLDILQIKGKKLDSLVEMEGSVCGTRWWIPLIRPGS